jgi:hydrogenase maturation protease
MVPFRCPRRTVFRASAKRFSGPNFDDHHSGLFMMTTNRPLIIGLGNLLAGDDAAGRVVAQKLAALGTINFDIAESSGEMSQLLALMDDRDQVLLIDACHSGAPIGTLFEFNTVATPLPSELSHQSTHGFGLAEAIELARALGKLPRRCTVYSIEGRCFDQGAELSPAVSQTIEDLFLEIKEFIT